PDGHIVSGGNKLQPVVDQPGTYFLKVANTLTGCSTEKSTRVEEDRQPPQAALAPPAPLTCASETTLLDGTGSSQGSSYAYWWTTPAGSFPADPTELTLGVHQPGTYALRVLDTQNGCWQEAIVEVEDHREAPPVEIEQPGKLTCAVTALQLNATGSAQGTQFQYQWSTNGGHILSGAQSLTPIITAPGTYRLEVLDTATGCAAAQEVVVEQDTLRPIADAGADLTLTCTNSVLTLDGTGSSQGAGFAYQWTGPGILSGAQTLTPTVAAPGTYVLEVLDTGNGCSAQSTVQVLSEMDLPLVAVAPPDTLTCANPQTTLSAEAEGAGPFAFSWSTSEGNIVSGATSAQAVVDAGGIYYLTVTDLANGCSATSSVFVPAFLEPPALDLGEPLLRACPFEELTLQAQVEAGGAPLEVEWTTPDGHILQGGQSLSPTVDAAGTYRLHVTNLWTGCSAEGEVRVSMDGPRMEPEVQQPGCAGETGSVRFASVEGGTPPYLFSIDGGEAFFDQPLFDYLEPGTYTLVVQDAAGCEQQQTVTLEAPEDLTLSVETEVAIQQGEDYQLEVLVNRPPEDIAQVSWSPAASLSCSDCLNPLASPLETTAYEVTVWTTEGCMASATLLIRVDERPDVFVPGAFSPDGDGINDRFHIFARAGSVSRIKTFRIFSRWGELIWENQNFQPNDPGAGWDGTYRGRLMDPAVFAWMAEIEFLDGTTRIFKGDVTLFR
ncbi:MAG: hypothetical protein D6765_02090, partial [Bacteroidetes bacterium]